LATSTQVLKAHSTENNSVLGPTGAQSTMMDKPGRAVPT